MTSTNNTKNIYEDEQESFNRNIKDYLLLDQPGTTKNEKCIIVSNTYFLFIIFSYSYTILGNPYRSVVKKALNKHTLIKGFFALRQIGVKTKLKNEFYK